jgi:hypothetical protein
MNYRIADILAEEDASTAKTKTIDITLRDIISRIFIRFKAQNGADRAVQAAHPAALVSKVELVDGSDVLFSLNGHEMQALNYYDQLVTPDTEIIDGNDDWQHACFMMDFGRYLFDPELAFDPEKFTNPQLKITHNYQAIDDGAAAGKLLVQAHIFDEKEVSPSGFLMTKQIQTYDSAAGAYEYIDLPTDHPIRKMMIRAYLVDKSVESEIDKVRLSEDNDKRIPIDVDVEPYIRYLCGTLPPINEHWQIRAQTTATVLFIMPTYWPMIYGLSQYSEDWWRASDYYQGDKQSIAADAAMSGPAMGYAQGYIPHQTLAFELGRQQEIDDWYDVTKIGSLRARIRGTASSSAAEVTLSLQQLRKYAAG